MSDTKIKTAQARGMYKTVNPLRTAMGKMWRKVKWRRTGMHLHRRAIIRGVRSVVRRHGQFVSGIVGIKTDRLNRIVNVLEGGFIHHSGKRVAGKHIRPRVHALAMRTPRAYAANLEAALLATVNGGSRRRGKK